MEREEINKITKHFVDQGLLIEAGWQTLKMISVAPNAPQIQIDEMRNAFFAGAQHLFSSIIEMLDPEAEITDNDIRRMDAIEKELNGFYKEFVAKHKGKI